MPKEEYQKLSFVPLPLIVEGDKYAEFKDLYGKCVDEKDRPSSKPASHGEEVDKKRKDIIVSSKVRCILSRQECFKPWCVYAKAKLKSDEKSATDQVQESRLFTCGSCLFPPDSPLSSVICVRENLSCGDPIELSYFSATLVHFPPVCYWCGLSEETLVRDQQFTDLARNYQTAHAICMFCKQEGKQPFTRHPLNAPKRRKT
jgi:hypothetical protein